MNIDEQHIFSCAVETLFSQLRKLVVIQKYLRFLFKNL